MSTNHWEPLGSGLVSHTALLWQFLAATVAELELGTGLKTRLITNELNDLPRGLAGGWRQLTKPASSSQLGSLPRSHLTRHLSS